MFNQTIYENRIEKIRAEIKNAGLDAIIISIEENRKYLSGYKGEDTQFDESAGFLLIAADFLILLTDSRFEEQAKNEAPFFETRIYSAGLSKTLSEIVREKCLEKIGFECSRMSVKQYNEIMESVSGIDTVFEPVENFVEKLRIIKDEDEISKTRKALHISEDVFKRIQPEIIPGIKETEAAWILEKKLREAGAEAMSFPVIAASGSNSSQPHAIPGEKRLNHDEMFLFDWGIKLDGYCSDITRTIFCGNPDDKFKKIFMTVYEAQQKAQKAVKAGASGREIDRIARDHIDTSGFRGYFGHSLGHGVGMMIHEAPRLSPIRDYTLEAGMIVTVEPGIYIPGWGGVRLENMVVVRDDGCEVLNSTDSLDFAHWI